MVVNVWSNTSLTVTDSVLPSPPTNQVPHQKPRLPFPSLLQVPLSLQPQLPTLPLLQLPLTLLPQLTLRLQLMPLLQLTLLLRLMPLLPQLTLLQLPSFQPSLVTHPLSTTLLQLPPMPLLQLIKSIIIDFNIHKPN
jgi:hypothetical protein